MSKGIGKRLAEIARPEAEYRSRQEATTLALQEQSAQMWDEVMNALTGEIQEFNQHIPASQRLNVLYGGQSWVFTFGNQPTLVIEIRSSNLELKPASRHNSVLDMWYSDGTLLFKGRSQHPGFQTPVLGMDEVIEGIMKLAIGQDW